MRGNQFDLRLVRHDAAPASNQKGWLERQPAVANGGGVLATLQAIQHCKQLRCRALVIRSAIHLEAKLLSPRLRWDLSLVSTMRCICLICGSS